MSNAYQQLLDAAIGHLQQLSTQGVRFVPLSNDTLAALEAQTRTGTPARTIAPPARPASPSATNTSVTASAPVTGRPQINRAAPPPALDLPIGPRGETVSAPTPPLSPEAKSAAFEDLRRRASACAKCPHLASSRRNVVFGVGNIHAELMFVGEAPGADEDIQGEPFVGKAGQLLTRIIQAMGLTRESVYIGNILKCRPDTPGQSYGNRKPTAEEMATCIPFLQEQLELIRPRVIVALGATAVEGLLGKTPGITRLRGNWKSYRGVPLMPTYHPAFLLRNQASSEKRKVWEDMLQVMEKLGLPISDRQRNFFLNT